MNIGFDERDWALIGDGILQGRYNLLLGAGVSLDSESGIPGEKCPSASALHSILFAHANGVRRNSSLNRVYKTLKSADVDALITKRFSACISGDSVRALSAFRWKRVFTLNVDDCLEHAYESADIQMQVPEPLNYVDPFEEARDPRRLPIVHLHGFARRPDDGYIFDISEYMRSIRQTNIWAHVLGQLIRTEPFIVVGTSLEEPDISYFLSDRSNLNFRTDRPPSILVEPNPDAATSVECNEFALKLYESTILDFCRELRDRFPDRPSVDDAIVENLGEDVHSAIADVALRAEFHADFERVPSSAVSGHDGGPLFALGHPATWQDICHGLDIERREAAEFQARVTSSTPGQTWIMLGEAGAGKSTLLKRVAWNLAQGGRLCFWMRSVGRLRVDAAIAALQSLTTRAYVFIDNFADNVVEVHRLRSALSSKDIVFVTAERSYRFDHIKRIYGESRIIDYKLDVIGVQGAKQLEIRYHEMGLFRKPREDSRYDPISTEIIAVACCRILNNFEPLSAIIQKSIEHSSDKDRQCYILTSLACLCYRTGVEYDIVSSVFRDYHVDIQADGNSSLPLKIVEVSGNEFVRPLNEAFSDGALKKIAVDNPASMLNAFQSLAHAIRPRVSVKAIKSGEPCAIIASRLFDYDEIVKPLLGIGGALEFFKNVEADWRWNSRYWHQISQLRMEQAGRQLEYNLKCDLAELAVQHARYSKAIEDRHQFTHTTIGRMLFSKFDTIGKATPAEIEEAFSSIGEAIKIERRKDRETVHPYMILFSGVESILDRGELLSFKQITDLKRRIQDARGRFAADRDLMSRIQSLSGRL